MPSLVFLRRATAPVAGLLLFAYFSIGVFAAVPPAKPGYQVNLPTAPGGVTYAPLSVPAWVDPTDLSTDPDGRLRVVSPDTPMPVAPPPTTYTAVTAFSVATGGAAQVAFSAGAIRTGCLIKNPSAASETLYFSLTGPAGTAEAGGTFGLAPGDSFRCPAPTGQALSVNAATGGHAFSATAY